MALHSNAMTGMNYEMLLRKIFACDRLGDPAKLADAGFFTDHNLRDLKTVLSYCVLVLYSKIGDGDGGEAFCESLHQQIGGAASVNDLESVVDDLRKRL